jgi:hypothetical protein
LSYDAEEFAGVAQQKCVAHLLRNVSEVLENKRGRARRFGETPKTLLRKGLGLWHARRDLAAEEYRRQAADLDQRVSGHLRNRILRDDDNQCLLNGIGMRHDRGDLLRFLETEGVEPTDHRAERMLRPAVIAARFRSARRTSAGPMPLLPSPVSLRPSAQHARQSIVEGFLEVFREPAAVRAR